MRTVKVPEEFKGQEEAWLDGYDQGYVVAKEDGYQDAYDEGYEEGCSDAENSCDCEKQYEEGLKEGKEQFLEDLGPYISEAIEALAGLADRSQYYRAIILEKLHDRNLR
jgi:flagellar biosynthesis/type III secretory pathway protein FliH